MSRKNYDYYDINEQQIGSYSGTLCYRHSVEKRMLDEADPILIENFVKVAKWIKKCYPRLNGEFRCKHNPFYWIKLVVENGKAFLECGSHGWDYDVALSETETATFSRGSMQNRAYAFHGQLFFRNSLLEEFLTQWPTIKSSVQIEGRAQRLVHSREFEA